MALLSEYPKRGSVVELTITPAPVSDITVERRFGSLDVDMPIFGNRNARKRLGQQFAASVAILLRLPVEHPVSSASHRTQRVSVATHLAVPMVVPPASDDRSKFARFYLGTIVRVIDDVFDFLTKSFEVRR